MSLDTDHILKAFTDNEHVVNSLAAADVTEYRVLGDFIGSIVDDEDYLPDVVEYERDQQRIDKLVDDGTLEKVGRGGVARYRLTPLGRAERLGQAA